MRCPDVPATWVERRSCEVLGLRGAERAVGQALSSTRHARGSWCVGRVVVVEVVAVAPVVVVLVASVVVFFERDSASSCALAASREFEDDRVVNEAVDGRSGGHGVLEDPVPVAEDEVAGDEDGAAFVALRHQREEDLDLVSALLDVANVVEDQQLEGVEPSERTGQVEVSLGREQFLDQAEGWREEDGVPAARQGVAECGGGVRLPRPGRPKQRTLCAWSRNAPVARLVELREDGAGNPGAVERFERLAVRQARSLEEPFGASLAALVGLGLEDLEQGWQSGLVSGVGEAADPPPSRRSAA